MITEHSWNGYDMRKSDVLGEEACSHTNLPVKISNGLVWDWTWTHTVTGWAVNKTHVINYGGKYVRGAGQNTRLELF